LQRLLETDRLQSQSQVRLRYVPLLPQDRGNAFDRRKWDRQGRARSKRAGHHADNFLIGADQRPAGKSSVEGQVRSNERVNLLSAECVPLAHQAGENAGACNQIAAPRAANCKEELTNSKLGLLGKSCSRPKFAIDVEDCDVRSGIASLQCGLAWVVGR